MPATPRAIAPSRPRHGPRRAPGMPARHPHLHPEPRPVPPPATPPPGAVSRWRVAACERQKAKNAHGRTQFSACAPGRRSFRARPETGCVPQASRRGCVPRRRRKPYSLADLFFYVRRHSPYSTGGWPRRRLSRRRGVDTGGLYLWVSGRSKQTGPGACCAACCGKNIVFQRVRATTQRGAVCRPRGARLCAG